MTQMTQHHLTMNFRMLYVHAECLTQLLQGTVHIILLYNFHLMMAGPLTRWSKVKVCSVIQFLSMKDVEAIKFIASSWRYIMETGVKVYHGNRCEHHAMLLIMARHILTSSSNPSMQAH